MKWINLIILLFISYHKLNAQYNLSKEQKYLIKEWEDYYGGQFYMAYNYPKANGIYRNLKAFSRMDFPILFGQTFQWGQAHHGGLIIIDYSSLNKNTSILAFIFAHEWGHQALGHQANIYNPTGDIWRIKTSSTQNEDQADFYSGKFIAKYGYDIDLVYQFLSNLPESPNDHVHSSGRKRAETVLNGYKSMQSSSSFRTVSCQHPLHPRGDISRCIHITHPMGDRFQCQHSCRNQFGYLIPCHPNGDLYNCSHLVHPNGDISQCSHMRHPEGDIVNN